MSVDDQNGRLCQFSKTKMCKFNVLGKCTKGEQCPFAHESKQLRNLPDLRCTKLCKMLIQTGQCTDKSCTYAHSKEELRSTGAFHKTKLCRFMQTGHCTLGGKCNFAHSTGELREPETIEGLPPPPGLGWESMLGGLLSDEDSSDEAPGKAMTQKARDKNVEPAYVRFQGMADQPWTFGAPTSISEESTDCEDGLGAFREDTGLSPFWDYQNRLAASSYALGDLSCYSPEGSHLAYGAGFGDWSSMWAGSPVPCAGSLYSGAFDPWDWRSFGDSVDVDQKDQRVKVKRSAKADKAMPKMRSVRTSESTLCTLSDNTQS